MAPGVGQGRQVIDSDWPVANTVAGTCNIAPAAGQLGSHRECVVEEVTVVDIVEGVDCHGTNPARRDELPLRNNGVGRRAGVQGQARQQVDDKQDSQVGACDVVAPRVQSGTCT